MAYEKQSFVAGQTLTAAQMNHIEEGIAAAHDAIENLPESSGGVVIDATLSKSGAAADAKIVGDIVTVLVEDKIDKQQGSENVGKILVIGSDGNVTLIDMPETGDIAGVVDGNNNILLTGTLADGTYTLTYKMADGTIQEVGSIVVGAIVHNILDIYDVQINKRWSNSSLSYIDANGFIAFEMPMEDVAGKTIRLKGFTKGMTANGGAKDSWYFYPEDKSYYGDFRNIVDASVSTSSVWNSNDLVDEGGGVYSIAINSDTVYHYDAVTTVIISIPVKDAVITETDLSNLVMTIDELIV